MGLLDRDWRFEDPTSALSNIYAFLYFFIGRAVLKDFGDQGEATLRRGLIEYGHFRGNLLRERHLAEGIELNVKNFMEHYDLPTDKRTTKDRKLVTPVKAYGENATCQFSDIWKLLEGVDPDGETRLGRIYCEAFHQAMCEGYHPDMKIDIPKVLTCGDDRCCFLTTLPGAENCKECPEKAVYGK